MLTPQQFRKIKIYFKDRDNNKLDISFFENYLNKDLPSSEKWFLRGCKHILENHYTEAIKRFQLSDSFDAKIMILSCSFKIEDWFMYSQYKDICKDYKPDLFDKFSFNGFIQILDKEFKIDKGICNIFESYLSKD